MCSKSSWLSTLSVPPFLPPLCASVAGVSTPLGALPELLELELLELEPQAASASANTPASATRATVLIDLVMGPPLAVLGPAGSPGGPWIQGILQAVAEQVERQNGQQQRDARESHVPPGGVEDGGGRGDHLAPAGRRRAHTHAEERQRRLEQDVRRDQQRGVHDDRRHQVRQDLAEHDARVRCAEGA